MTSHPSNLRKLFQSALKLKILSKNTNVKRYKDNQRAKTVMATFALKGAIRAKTVMAPFSAKVAVSVIDQSCTCY